MDKELKALRSELALMKLQFSERLKDIELRIETIGANDAEKIDEIGANPAPEIIQLASNDTTSPITTEAYFSAEKKSQIKVLPVAKKLKEPNFFSLFLQSVIASIFDWFAPIQKIYQSYKDRDMLGIFILTLVGIALTVAGFGYLMQLLIDQLGAGAKSLLMGAAAVSVMAVGIGLKIKTRYDEFATAIVTLGILLSYSTVYFSGSVYRILPDVAVSTFYLFIAFLCHFLALRLDTKIVAGLGIIGICSMPLLSNTGQLNTLTYGLSLLFVSVSSLVLAYKYLGQWLANLTLVFVIVALEWNVGVAAVEMSAWMINLFYLLFFTYSAISIMNNKQETKAFLVFLSALVGSTLLLFLQTHHVSSTVMSLCFLVNALSAIVFSMVLYKLKHAQIPFFILLSALWGILTIVSMLSSAYWGIAWAAEGLLLLYIGRNYRLSSVIHQGQVLISLALLYSLSALALYFPLPALQSIDGWVMSLVIVIVIGFWQRMINELGAFDQFTVDRIKPFLMLLESIWLSVLLIGCSIVWLGLWTGGAVILVQLALLFRAKHCKQTSIEVFAVLLFFIPIIYMLYGGLLEGSYRFTELPTFAKVAVISAFLQLWLWSAFYRKYHPESKIKRIAETTRIIFYLLIPVFWLSSVVRRLDENVLTVLWLSPALALLLAEKIKHPLLILEAKVLSVLSSLCFVLFIGWLEPAYGIATFTGFVCFYGAAYIVNRKVDNTILLQLICSNGLIALGFALPCMIVFSTESVFYALLSASIYWALSFHFITSSTHLKRNEKVITLVNALIIISAWIMTLENSLFSGIPVLFIFAAIMGKQQKYSHSWIGKVLSDKSDLMLHSLAAITYTLLLASLDSWRLDLLIAPALAVHGAIILFMKDNRLITVKYCFTLIGLGIVKLAFVDAENALLWQKVILFMGIGLFILMAAFWYQKLINKNKRINESINTTD